MSEHAEQSVRELDRAQDKLSGLVDAVMNAFQNQIDTLALHEGV